MTTPSYQITDKYGPLGFNIIEVTSGPLNGLQYTYSQVRVGEEQDRGRLSFDYNLVSVPKSAPRLTEVSTNKAMMINTMGDILMDIITKQQDVLYYGGT